MDAVLGHDVGNVEGQVGPVQVGAVFEPPVALEADIGLQGIAPRIGVVAVAVVAVAADGDAAVEPLAYAAHSGLRAAPAEAAAFEPHPAAFVGAGEGDEIELAAQRGGGGRCGIGAAQRADIGCIARLDQADDERAIRFIQRQAVLQEQHAPVDRVALDARATNAQARLVGATKEILHHDARLVVERVAQSRQTRFLLRLGQIGAARHLGQLGALGLHAVREREQGAVALGMDGDSGQWGGGLGPGRAGQRDRNAGQATQAQGAEEVDVIHVESDSHLHDYDELLTTCN